MNAIVQYVKKYFAISSAIKHYFTLYNIVHYEMKYSWTILKPIIQNNIMYNINVDFWGAVIV